jgi:hypothetical protein
MEFQEGEVEQFHEDLALRELALCRESGKTRFTSVASRTSRALPPRSRAWSV